MRYSANNFNLHIPFLTIMTLADLKPWAKARSFDSDCGRNHLSQQRLQTLPQSEDNPRIRRNRELEKRDFGP